MDELNQMLLYTIMTLYEISSLNRKIDRKKLLQEKRQSIRGKVGAKRKYTSPIYREREHPKHEAHEQKSH